MISINSCASLPSAIVMESDSVSCEGEIFVCTEEEISTSNVILDAKEDEMSQDSVFSDGIMTDGIIPAEVISHSVSVEEFKKLAECAEAIVQLENVAKNSDDIETKDASQILNSTPTVLVNEPHISESSENSLEQFLNVSHTEVVPEEEKYVCQHCGKKLSNSGNMYRHYRVVHNLELRKKDAYSKCLECDAGFMHVAELRTHLQTKHNYNMGMEELTFHNMEAFFKWKNEVERETMSHYTVSHRHRKTSEGIARYFACHRSGKFNGKVRGPRKRMMRATGTCKIGIRCTSAINLLETPTGVHMKYFPNHYGHGKETTLIILTEEEEKAIAESADKGVTYDNVISEMQESQATTDPFQLCVLRKKYSTLLTKAFESEEFNLSITDTESVDRWIGSCCKMENSPILAYQRDECVDDKKTLNFFLVIMTEFQKHILMTSTKKVICVDVLFRQRVRRGYLTSLLALDDTDFPVPVAFCLSNKVDREVMSMFFAAVVDQTGPLAVEYFMSDSEPMYHEVWKEVMNDSSKWLWNMWHVENRLRFQLKVFKGNTARKAQIFKTIKNLIECKNQFMFSSMYKDFIENLSNDFQSKNIGLFIQQRYGSNPEKWAYCYRKDIPFATNAKLEMMHTTLKYCCQLGRHRRLDKFLVVLMKFLRDKMLYRLSYLTEGGDVSLATDNIDTCHNFGLEIPPEYVTSLANKIWLVLTDSEDEHLYVTLENETCPELCSLKCSECDICVHNYSCTCNGNLINGNLCEHIHAVVWNFVTPHYSPAISDAEDNLEEPEVKLELLENLADYKKLHRKALKVAHEVYKKIEINKTKMSEKSLESVVKRLNDCLDICSGNLVDASAAVSQRLYVLQEI